jgi:DUF4097 and DUF4098 domain-containing protein YvlB
MKTFETPQPITATIDVTVGAVRVIASERADTAVDVQPSDGSNKDDVRAAELTRVDLTHDQLVVKVPKLRSWRPRSDGGSVEVTVELPAWSHVRGAMQFGDFECAGALGDVRVRSGMGQIRVELAGSVNLKNGLGDITVDGVTGRAEVTTGSGEVRVRDVGADAVIKNSNGDIWVGAVGGDLRLQAANGSIAVDVARGSVVAKSANGDVRLGEVERGSVVLETKLGDLEVGIPEGTAAWLDVRATAGRVHNSLDAAAAPDSNGDTVEVRARTVAGDVVVRRP